MRVQRIVSLLQRSESCNVKQISEELGIPLSSAWSCIDVNKERFSLGWEAIRAKRGIKWRRVVSLNKKI